MANRPYIEYDEDGNCHIRHPRIKGYPTFSDWTRFLLDRGLAIEETVKWDGETRKGITPLSARLHQQAARLSEGDFGVALIICIRCGESVSQLDADTIRVGALVQFPETIQTAPREFTTNYTIRPTARSGMGCKACQADYLTAINEANKFNDASSEIDLIRAQMALLHDVLNRSKTTPFTTPERCLHGLDKRFCAVCLRNAGAKRSSSTIQTTTMRSAYIDISTLIRKRAGDR